MARRYGSSCMALNCNNKKAINKDKSFFSFPSDPERCRKWIEHCQRTDLLDKHPVYLHARCKICSDHFEDHYFVTQTRKRLTADAVPTICVVPVAERENYEDSDSSDETCDFITEEVVSNFNGEDVEIVVLGEDAVLSESKETLDADKICRICARPSEEFVPIYKQDGVVHKIEEKIHKYLPIKVASNDDLPLQICPPCLKQLNVFHELVKSCVEGEKKLKALFTTSVNDRKLLPKKQVIKIVSAELEKEENNNFCDTKTGTPAKFTRSKTRFLKKESENQTNCNKLAGQCK